MTYLVSRDSPARPALPRGQTARGLPVAPEPAPRHPLGGGSAPPGDRGTVEAETPGTGEGGAASPAVLQEQGRRICRLAQEAAEAGDAEPALRVLTELRGELDAFERLHVGRGLAAGRSFAELARVLGISRQAAHRRYRELAPRRRRPRRLEATEHVRQVIRIALAETCAAGRTAVGSRELLLAILRTDRDAARALRAQGVTLEAARACRAVDGDGGDPAGLRRILQRAGRLALGRRDRQLASTHLLLALVADSDRGAAHTLAALGTTPASIRAALS